METKKEIRHKIIRLRKEMDPLVWQQATNDITERVINHPRFLEETDIYCYANYNGEVGTSSIMEEAWKLGKSVWFPRIEGSEMNFYLVESKDDLQPGAYGILEPTGDHIADGEDGLLIMLESLLMKNATGLDMAAAFMTNIWKNIRICMQLQLHSNCRCTENFLLRNMI